MASTPLPPLYARWIEAALGTELAEESRATCFDCPMCAAGDQGPLPGERRFTPSSKCCTYFPFLPSFRVGQILDDEAPDAQLGRSIVAQLVQRRMGATPLGLSPPPAYLQRYEDVTLQARFGLDPALTCPYLDEDGGKCSIWRHREGVCATFFCKHVDGVKGARLWGAILQLLKLVERELVGHCTVAFELDAAALSELYFADGTPCTLSNRELRGPVGDLDGAIGEDLARRVWGSWYGREMQYYVACGRWVAELDWQVIRAVGGSAIAQSERRARAALAALRRPVGEVVCLGINESVDVGGGLISLCSAETIHDPVRVSAAVADGLRELDGRPTAQVAAELGIGDDTLKSLIHHGILVEPDGRHLPPERPAAVRPIEKSDVLCFFRGFHNAEVQSSRSVSNDGRPVLSITTGGRQLTLDETDLIAFGEQLLKHQNGFRAGDAVDWAGPGKSYPWERISELLQLMLVERVLVRITA